MKICKHCLITFKRPLGVPIPDDCCTRCNDEIEALWPNYRDRHNAKAAFDEMMRILEDMPEGSTRTECAAEVVRHGFRQRR